MKGRREYQSTLPRINITRLCGGGCLEFNNSCDLQNWGEGTVRHVPFAENKDKLTNKD